MVRKILKSSVLRKRVVDLVPPLFRSAMDMILFNDLILLRLMSSDYMLLASKIGKRPDGKSVFFLPNVPFI
jgi:hypothetical protein